MEENKELEIKKYKDILEKMQEFAKENNLEITEYKTMRVGREWIFVLSNKPKD
ncbi:MAG: hypothetical protein LBQ34_02925 [Alphaproteobacteria bacterium]|jgi:predicted methyltransferase|nr:hypothetical protein [Alphaproteobacteria bacterium]